MLENIISEFLKKRKPIHRPLIEVGVFSAEEYKNLNEKDSLRDNMSNAELLCVETMETATVIISQSENPSGYSENYDVAMAGVEVAKATREALEKRLGRSVVTSLNARDFAAIAAGQRVAELEACI